MNHTGNKKWPQYLITVTSVILTFSAGIHYGWPTPSLPKLLSKEHPLQITSDEGSYIISIGSLGDIVGNIVFTLLADMIGRKVTTLLIAVPQIFSMLMLHFSSRSLFLVYFGRFLGGVSEGACLCIIPIYIGEISEPRIRGVLIAFFSIAWSSGCLFINIVGSYNTIETTSLVTLIFPLVFLVSFSILAPESPYFLIIRNEIKKCRLTLQKLRSNENIEEELIEITRDVQRQMSERGKYQDLWLIKSNRSAFLIMVAVSGIIEFTGISSLTFYAQIFFMKTTDFLSEMWASSLIIFLQLVCCIISSFTVDYMGRRPLLLSSIAGCGSSLTLLSFYFFLNDYSSIDVSSLKWIPLVSFVLFIIFFNLGGAIVVNCLGGELFSASIKTKASCMSAIMYSIFVIIVTKTYQVLSDNCSLAVPFGVFAFAQLAGWIFCWRFVPETRGKTLEEIQQVIKGKKRNEGTCLQPLLQT